MNLREVDVEELVPHAGPMVLLECVIAVAEDTLTAEVIVRADGLFDDSGKVPAILGVEYMAQAIAAWAGYHAKQRGEQVLPGLLLGTRQYQSSTADFLVGEKLDVAVELVMQSSAGLAVFDCTIHNQRVTVSARLTVLTVESLDSIAPA